MKIRYKTPPYAGYEAYRIGTDGSIWSRHNRQKGKKDAKLWFLGKWVRLKCHIACDGYLYTAFQSPVNGRMRVAVHVMVLETFVGPRPKGMHACHYDGDKLNNHLSNLRWDTPKGNGRDKIRHGKSLKGEKNHQAKLTEGNVQMIRKLRNEGDSINGLAKRFKVDRVAIYSLLDGRTWKHVL